MVVAIFETATEDYSVVARSFCRRRQNDQREHWRGVLHHRRFCFAQKRTIFLQKIDKNRQKKRIRFCKILPFCSQTGAFLYHYAYLFSLK